MPDTFLRMDTTPGQLFRSELANAFAELRLTISPEIHVYVTGLLVSVVKRDVGTAGRPQLLERTLASDMLRAEALDGSARIALLKEVGDAALLLSGYWWRLLEFQYGRNRYDVDYHRLMGEVAYRTVSYDHPQERLAALFADLAKDFVVLTEALAHVSARLQVRDHRQLLKIYSEYLETHSRRLAQILLAQGLPVPPGPGQSH